MKAVLLGGLVSIHAQQFSFGAAGDFSTRPEFLATVEAVKAGNVSFMLALGDLAYEENKEEWWCQQWKTRGVSDLLIAAGNHDVGESCCGNLQAYLDNCPRTIQVEGEPGVQYYFDYPAVNPLARFVVITPGVKGDVESYSDYTKDYPGYVWVESSIDDARTKNIRWVIVAFHKNFISVLTKTDEVGPDLMALLFSKRVDLILQGHEHGYERSKSLTCARVDVFNQSCVAEVNPTLRGKGSTIIVLGTGGQALRTRNDNDPERSYFQVVDVTTFGYGHFAVSAEKIVYNFRRSAGGALRDSFTLKYPTTPTASRPPSIATTPTTAATPTAATPTTSSPPTPGMFPTESIGEEDYTYSPTNPTQAPPAQATTFAYDGAAVIAIICIFLVVVAVLAVFAVFLIIRQNMKKTTPEELDLGHHEEAPAKKTVARTSKLGKRQSEGTIDYL